MKALHGQDKPRLEHKPAVSIKKCTTERRTYLEFNILTNIISKLFDHISYNGLAYHILKRAAKYSKL